MNKRLLVVIGALAVVGAGNIVYFTATPAFAQSGGSGHSGEHENDGEESDPMTAAVDIYRASQSAQDNIDGYVRGAELEDEEGTVVWEVSVVQYGTGNVFEVSVDATSGSVLSTKQELDDDDEEDDGEHEDDDAVKD